MESNKGENVRKGRQMCHIKLWEVLNLPFFLVIEFLSLWACSSPILMWALIKAEVWGRGSILNGPLKYPGIVEWKLEWNCRRSDGKTSYDIMICYSSMEEFKFGMTRHFGLSVRAFSQRSCWRSALYTPLLWYHPVSTLAAFSLSFHADLETLYVQRIKRLGIAALKVLSFLWIKLEKYDLWDWTLCEKKKCNIRMIHWYEVSLNNKSTLFRMYWGAPIATNLNSWPNCALSMVLFSFQIFIRA